MKAAVRPKFTAEEIRSGLLMIGLHEEEKPIDGYGFLFTATPIAAVTSYQALHGGTVPRRFYIDRRTFILAD